MSEILSGLGALCGCFSRPPPVEEDPWYLPKLFHELPPEEVQLMERGHLVIQVRRKKEMWLKLCVTCTIACHCKREGCATS